MNYILDDLGYVEEISFGGKIVCSNKSCTEYNGNIPSGYETLLDWSLNANIRAYKIVDGNLVYDGNKDKELQLMYKRQSEENCCATKKYVNDKLNVINMVYDDELSSSKDGSSLFSIDNTKHCELPIIKISRVETIQDNLKLFISNENMLLNKALTNTVGGITFTINEDKTINLNGTSMEDVEFILNGSLTSEEELFFLKANQNYMQCGLTNNVTINLYNFDGVDRTLISSIGNGTINLNETSYITCASLYIPSGKTFKNVTIKPMLTIGVYEEKEYIESKANELTTINFGEYGFKGKDYLLINRNKVEFHKFVGIYPSAALKPSTTLYPMKEHKEIIESTIEALLSFDGKTIIQCDKNVNFEVKYFSKDYLNEQFASIQVEQDKITLEVSKKIGDDEVISKINQSAESITINADKLNLTGYLTISNANSTYATNEGLATKGSTIINGDNITTGTISAERLDAKVITTDNFSAQTINADKITTGSISATRVSGGTLSGVAININNYFSVNSNGGAQISTSSGGFFSTRTTQHPYMSAINVASGSGGIMFVSGTAQDNVGSNLGKIYGSTAGNVVIKGNNGTWIQDIYVSDGIQINGNSDACIRLNYSIVLRPNTSGGAYIWGTEDYNRILTSGGSPSTLSIKENVRLKDTSDISNILSQIELYDYNYIDEVENGKDDYGYIIDYLESIEGIDKYFKFNKIERNNLKYKTINHEHLQKFLLGAVIELQKQVNELKGGIL